MTTPMALKLYHFPGSRSARVRWALLETVGDRFTVQPMKLMQGEQYAPEFLAINPNHAVPVLEIQWEDGSVQHMLESAAMVEWLADAHPQKQLAPAPGLTRERADYLQMLHFGGSSLDAILWQLRVHRDLLPEEQADAQTIQRAMDKVADEAEPQLLARLERSPYICGDRFSAADILIGHDVQWARMYGLCKDDAFSRYIGRLSQRDAYRRAFDDLPARPV